MKKILTLMILFYYNTTIGTEKYLRNSLSMILSKAFEIIFCTSSVDHYYCYQLWVAFNSNNGLKKTKQVTFECPISATLSGQANFTFVIGSQSRKRFM